MFVDLTILGFLYVWVEDFIQFDPPDGFHLAVQGMRYDAVPSLLSWFVVMQVGFESSSPVSNPTGLTLGTGEGT